MAGAYAATITTAGPDGPPILDLDKRVQDASASKAFAALKSEIGACLTALMQAQAMDEGDAVDMLEEVVSDEDLAAETAALAGEEPGGGRRKNQRRRAAPKPPRGVKRAASGEEDGGA